MPEERLADGGREAAGAPRARGGLAAQRPREQRLGRERDGRQGERRAEVVEVDLPEPVGLGRLRGDDLLEHVGAQEVLAERLGEGLRVVPAAVEEPRLDALRKVALRQADDALALPRADVAAREELRVDERPDERR